MVFQATSSRAFEYILVSRGEGLTRPWRALYVLQHVLRHFLIGSRGFLPRTPKRLPLGHTDFSINVEIVFVCRTMGGTTWNRGCGLKRKCSSTFFPWWRYGSSNDCFIFVLFRWHFFCSSSCQTEIKVWQLFGYLNNHRCVKELQISVEVITLSILFK